MIIRYIAGEGAMCCGQTGWEGWEGGLLLLGSARAKLARSPPHAPEMEAVAC